MPIFRANGQNVYYIHIPKCAGTSIHAALELNNVNIAFYDTQFWKRGPNRWYNSSPQHIKADDLEKLFDPSFFDLVFTVIRNPLDRFVSAFNFNHARIGLDVNIDTFVEALKNQVKTEGNYFGNQYDNHFEPFGSFIFGNPKIFVLENGLDEMYKDVFEPLGLKIPDKPVHENSGQFVKLKTNVKNLLRKTHFVDPEDISSKLVRDIEEIYAADMDFYQRHRK